MGQDIHRMLEAKRALLLAISHELRSPLTRARLHTELLPDTRHRFLIDSADVVSEARLDIYPDGGLARLRLFGDLA